MRLLSHLKHISNIGSTITSNNFLWSCSEIWNEFKQRVFCNMTPALVSDSTDKYG